MSDGDRKALLEECAAYEAQLKTGGHCVDEASLRDPRTATTLRFDSGRMSVTDGPFAETKEQLGGVMVLEATDLNHAIALMSQLPCMRLGGSLEIRPIDEDADCLRRNNT